MAGEDCPELSARFSYRLSLNVHDSDEDDGTYIRTAMQGVKALGCATERSFPFGARRVLDPIPLSAIMASHDRKGLRGYQRIASGDVERVKQAIASGFPVVAGWQVSEAFLDWNGREPIGAQTSSVGGHAMVIVGYDGDVFDLANSWGPVWGRTGHALVTRAFMAQARDLWIVDVRGDA
jgi:C1A family cysteine protease